MGKKRGLFSADIHLIPVVQPLKYDLYINSSTHPSRNNFVKIAKIGASLTWKELEEMQERFHQIYISEEQRGGYLNALVSLDSVGDQKKGNVIKGFALDHLDQMFKKKKNLSTEGLNQIIQGCMETIESMIELTKDYDISKIHGLIEKLIFHDFYTYDHSVNVSFYNIALLKHISPDSSNRDLKTVGLGGLLHDLGKIEIPTNIINKPGKLTEKEFQKIKEHPDIGFRLILEKLNSPEVKFDTVRRIVHEHHENYNGSGYPRGLKGKEIHRSARITAISDFFDALTTKRSYQRIHSVGEALNIMSHSSGGKIDPDFFDLFRKSIGNKDLGGRKNLKLGDDFDPCQPQEEFPLMETSPRIQVKNIDLDL